MYAWEFFYSILYNGDPTLATVEQIAFCSQFAFIVAALFVVCFIDMIYKMISHFWSK